jgi:hypothetical protein
VDSTLGDYLILGVRRDKAVVAQVTIASESSSVTAGITTLGSATAGTTESEKLATP